MTIVSASASPWTAWSFDVADLSDVSDGLRDLIRGVFYPDGLEGETQPDTPVKVYPGWPDPETIDKDLGDARGPLAHHVSIYPLPMERDVTRSLEGFEANPLPTASYGLTLAGQAITVTGAAPEPYRIQNLLALIDGKHYAHQATPGQTAEQVAAALAAKIAAAWPGTTTVGAEIVVPSPARIRAVRVGVVGTAQKVASQQEKGFQVTIWAESHEARTALAKRIAPVLADTAFLTLSDGTGARLVCRSNSDRDVAQARGAYCRDLVYTVEYVTTVERVADQLIAPTTEITGPGGVAIANMEA